MHMRQRVGVVVTTLLVALGSVFAVSSPAQARASAQGCTTTGIGILCNTTWGSKLRVNHVKADVSWGGKWVCNRQFRVWGKLKNGRTYSRYVTAKCGYVKVWIDVYPKADFAKNSKLCVAVRDASVKSNAWQAYNACVKIKA